MSDDKLIFQKIYQQTYSKEDSNQDTQQVILYTDTIRTVNNLTEDITRDIQNERECQYYNEYTQQSAD